MTPCVCCEGKGEHQTGFECYRCDASGQEKDARGTVPCDGREDSPNVWVDDQGSYRHAEERSTHTQQSSTGVCKGLRPVKGLYTKAAERTDEDRQAEGQAKVAADRAAADVFETQLVSILRAEFDIQKTEVLTHLDTGQIGKSLGGRFYRKKDYLDDLADWDALSDAMRRSVQPVLFSVISDSGNRATQGLGLDSSMFDPITTAILDYYKHRATKIAGDVTDETAKQLRASLGKAIADGAGPEELRAVVEDVMGIASTIRADRIARTEVSRAQGYGDVQAWSQSGLVSGKEWFTAEDEHVCVFCDAMDGKIIPLDEDFFSKGDTWYPTEGSDQNMTFSYDDVPSAPLHPNCRCTLLPIRSA